MTIRQQRTNSLLSLFHGEVPCLWCPPLTHFESLKVPSVPRIEAHLRWMSPYVRGILVPGSTGEGWQMSDDDIERLLDIVLPIASQLKMHVLIGILKTDIDSVLQAIERFEERSRHPNVVGFTICPPKGSGLSQDELFTGISRVMETGHRFALYQLPQVTQNELTASTVAQLAHSFPNFLLFKDTSGEDRVIDSAEDYHGVFFLRGAEAKGYSSFSKGSGGRYDGFLLSSANTFARPLSEMLAMIDRGEIEHAATLSRRIEAAIGEMFAVVAPHPIGNAFTNANKCFEHWMAWGDQGPQQECPMLYDGSLLPRELVDQAKSILIQHEFFQSSGYIG